MDAVDRADLDARVVLGADAGLCDDVGHGLQSLVSVNGRRDGIRRSLRGRCFRPRRPSRGAVRPRAGRPRAGPRPAAASPPPAGGRRAGPRSAARPRRSRAGTDIAGWPVTLNSAVYGREAAGAPQVVQRLARRSRAARRSAAAGSASDRREQHVVVGEERDRAAREQLQLRERGRGSPCEGACARARAPRATAARSRPRPAAARRASRRSRSRARPSGRTRARKMSSESGPGSAGASSTTSWPSSRSSVGRVVQPAHDLGVDVDAERVVERHRDPQPARVAPHARACTARRAAAPRSRRRPRSPTSTSSSSAVSIDGAREHAVGAEEGVAEVGPARDPAAARLEADEPAAGGGDAQRAAAVVAVRDRARGPRRPPRPSRPRSRPACASCPTGCGSGPVWRGSVVGRIPNSGRFVVPTTTNPASRSRRTR